MWMEFDEQLQGSPLDRYRLQASGRMLGKNLNRILLILIFQFVFQNVEGQNSQKSYIRVTRIEHSHEGWGRESAFDTFKRCEVTSFNFLNFYFYNPNISDSFIHAKKGRDTIISVSKLENRAGSFRRTYLKIFNEEGLLTNCSNSSCSGGCDDEDFNYFYYYKKGKVVTILNKPLNRQEKFEINYYKSGYIKNIIQYKQVLKIEKKIKNADGKRQTIYYKKRRPWKREKKVTFKYKKILL